MSAARRRKSPALPSGACSLGRGVGRVMAAGHARLTTAGSGPLICVEELVREVPDVSELSLERPSASTAGDRLSPPVGVRYATFSGLYRSVG